MSRKTVNSRIGKIKRAFKWAAAEELIDHQVYVRLQTVAGLQAGRTEAAEYEPIPPVPDAVVDQTLPKLHPVLAAMVQLQRHSGMRPGEVCRLTPGEIDQAGPVAGGVQLWVYSPARHKTRHRGKVRAVVLGPKAQAVLGPYMDRPADQFCFRPEEATAQFHAARKASRKKRRPPSHDRTLAKRKAKRQPKPFAPHYTPASYYGRIRKVCARHGIPHWSPNQLRHTAATEIASRFGLDTARAVLGHADPKVTTIYAERDLQAAARVAAEIG